MLLSSCNIPYISKSGFHILCFFFLKGLIRKEHFASKIENSLYNLVLSNMSVDFLFSFFRSCFGIKVFKTVIWGSHVLFWSYILTQASVWKRHTDNPLWQNTFCDHLKKKRINSARPGAIAHKSQHKLFRSGTKRWIIQKRLLRERARSWKPQSKYVIKSFQKARLSKNMLRHRNSSLPQT